MRQAHAKKTDAQSAVCRADSCSSSVAIVAVVVRVVVAQVVAIAAASAAAAPVEVAVVAVAVREVFRRWLTVVIVIEARRESFQEFPQEDREF